MVNKLQCELCGSIEIKKTDDGYFVCEYCGCKYSLEQARVLIGGTFTTVAPDFNIRAGRLEKYNGESVFADIPKTATIIGDEAFADCPGLMNVEIPDTVHTIGNNSFMGCSGLQNITLPESISKIGQGAFRDCCELLAVKIPENVTYLSPHCFERCKNLKSVILPQGLETVGAYAFAGCKNLQNIEIPDSVTKIEAFAFWGCESIENIYIPECTELIGENAFSHCDNVNEIICKSNAVLPYFIQNFSPSVDVNSFMSYGRCRFCGGEFKGLFTKKCRICEHSKDYRIKKGKLMMIMR